MRFILYDVKKGYLKKITPEEIDLSENDSFVVNFCADDERVLVQAGIPTISMQKFLSMCGGYVVNDSDMDAVLRYMTGCCYNNIFGSSRVDFAILYESASYWRGISRIISQGMNLIEQQGLEDALRLEIETSKALHHMMDEVYPLNAKARNINMQGLPKTIRKCLLPRKDGNKACRGRFG